MCVCVCVCVCVVLFCVLFKCFVLPRILVIIPVPSMPPHTTQAPELALTTEADMLALRQVYNRVVGIANDNPEVYEPLSAETHPEVATCEAVIASMVLHIRTQQRQPRMSGPFMRYEQKAKQDEVQEQREEEVKEACTNKLLIQLRAAREKVRMCVLACMSTCIRVYVFI